MYIFALNYTFMKKGVRYITVGALLLSQNLRVALNKYLISCTLETLVLSTPCDEEQITKVLRLYLLRFVFMTL